MTRPRRSLLLAALLLIGMAVFARAGRAQGPAILINEILVGNAGTTLDADYTNFSSWIELRNTTGSGINLKNYRVAFVPEGETAALTYTIKTNVTVPGNGRAILWADEKGKGPHLSYDLDMDGGELTLRNPNGAVVDQVTFGPQSPDVSYGRTPDGGAGWAFYDQPTFGQANNAPTFANNNPSSFAARPQFSAPGGPRTGTLNVSLSSPDAGATIRYTTDGSRPTNASTLYTGPIAVNGNTVLRARAWVAGKMVSPTATQTYLINIPTNLPIISVVTDPPNLWDNYMGIYVRGSNGVSDCRGTANWHRKWERPASIEVYETNGTPRVNQEVGLEISGNCTRNFPQKSLEIKAKKIYGDNDMGYAFFAGDKPMTSYSRLILRNGGNDNYHAYLRDSFAQTLALGRMDVDRQAYRPAVVYLNGQYWGLYDMREKMDEDYVENNYNLDEDEFDFLEKNFRVMNGSDDAFREFYNFMKSVNVAQPSGYAQVQQRMDVNEFMNYLIIETFSANTDWGRNNVRYWDDYADNYRWRWALHDLDFSFFVKNANKDMFAYSFRATNPMGFIAKKLWDNNADYRNEFTQRYAAHLNTTFSAARINALIDSMAAGIRPEMAAQTARWGKPATVAAWEAEVQELRTVALQRVGNSRAHLRKRIGNNPDSTLTIDIVGDGRVLVAGVEVTDGYSGPHFRNIPINFTALPGQGDTFSHWEIVGPGDTFTTAAVSLPFSGDMTLRAVFDAEPPPPPAPNLVINELHHSPVEDNAYEFLEIYNPGAVAVNLSGFTFFGVDFTFPPGSSIAPGEYIVVADTPANYTGNGYQVFDFNGGLSGSGETITLFDTFNQPSDSVTYGTVAPWPANTNGTNLSLSLLDTALDNTVATNWAASREEGGSPGALNFPPLPPTPPVVINEIHYNPTGGAAEFIELVNNGSDPVALDDYYFSGVDFIFPAGTNLAAGGYLVVAAPGHSYPGALNWTSGDLADDGETLALLDGDDQTVDTVAYDDEAPWPTAPDGSGPSLALGRVALDNSVATNWAASRETGGTPGTVNFPPLPVVINEIHHTSPAPLNDDTYEFLELYNAGSGPIDLSGYTLFGVTFTFPPGSTIAAGEYIVVADTPATYGPYQVFDFSGGLSGSGETVTVSDPFGNVADTVAYGVAAPWPTTTSTGPSLSLLDPALDNSLAASWDASRDNGGSPGAENFPPLPPVPPVVINEIHYNPTGGAAEFIELVNNGPDPVALDGFTFSGVDFIFPAGTNLAAGGYLVIAADNTGQPTWLQWTAGDLADDGETLALLDGDSQTVDEVTYDDEAPWPTAPDGSGPSLALGRVALDNSVATNWAASRETGGTPGTVNFPPLPIVINELHHTPAAPLVDNTYEFLELYNGGSSPIDIGGYIIGGVDAPTPLPFFPAGTMINPGEYIVVADTPATYSGNGYQVFDFNGGLSDNGEMITVSDAFGNLVDTVTYDDVAPWPVEPDGGGPSLSLLDPALDNSLAASWDASRDNGGSPGAENFPPLPPTPPVVINEIHYNPAGGSEFIELVNNGPDPVALDGFTFSGIDFTFPADTDLAAGGYLVIAADNTGQPTWLQWTAGDLADDGETLTLLDGAAQVVDEVAYDDEAPWPTAPDGSGPSLSLLNPSLDNSAGANWAASDFVGGTPGAANFPALPVVINEIHYNPVITPTVGIEFIELANTGAAAVVLSDFMLSGVSYTFPAGTTLAAGGYLVIAADATGQPSWLQWTSGDLADDGETLALLDSRNQTVDMVAYADSGDWPTEPDGSGPSLALDDPALDNGNPLNWSPSVESGGTPGAVNFQ